MDRYNYVFKKNGKNLTCNDLFYRQSIAKYALTYTTLACVLCIVLLLLYNYEVWFQYSVKRSDVTGNRSEWLLGAYFECYVRHHPPYFIVLASLMKTLQVKAIEFDR